MQDTWRLLGFCIYGSLGTRWAFIASPLLQNLKLHLMLTFTSSPVSSPWLPSWCPLHWSFLASDLSWGLHTLEDILLDFSRQPPPQLSRAIVFNLVRFLRALFFTRYALILAETLPSASQPRSELWGGNPFGVRERAFTQQLIGLALDLSLGHTLASCAIIGDNYLTSTELIFSLGVQGSQAHNKGSR